MCCVKIKCSVLFRGKNISVALQLSVSRLNIPFTDDIVFYFVFFFMMGVCQGFFFIPVFMVKFMREQKCPQTKVTQTLEDGSISLLAST